MKELIKKAKVPIGILIFIFVVFFIYNNFIKKDNTDAIVEKSTEKSETRQRIDKDLIPLLSLVKKVKFDSELFSDPVFKSLADFTSRIEPESVGRSNPFGGDLVGSSQVSNDVIDFENNTQVNTSSSTKSLPAS